MILVSGCERDLLHKFMVQVLRVSEISDTLSIAEGMPGQVVCWALLKIEAWIGEA